MSSLVGMVPGLVLVWFRCRWYRRRFVDLDDCVVDGSFCVGLFVGAWERGPNSQKIGVIKAYTGTSTNG